MASREQFESWYFKRYGVKDLTVVRNHAEFCDALEVWQASRDAIEIELPDIYGGKYTPSSITMDGFDFDEYLTDLYAVIEQANIKVKK